MGENQCDGGHRDEQEREKRSGPALNRGADRRQVPGPHLLAVPGGGAQEAHQGAQIARRESQDAEVGGPHVVGSVDPRDRDLLDVVSGKERPEARLRVGSEVRPPDVELLEDLGAVELQVVGDVADPSPQENPQQQVKGSIGDDLGERVVDQNRVV